MEGMIDGDSFIYDPIALFASQLNKKLPGKNRTLRDKCDEQVVEDTLKWLAEFQPLALKGARQEKTERQLEKQREVVEETHKRAKEMSLYIQAAAVRHPEIIDQLKPRVGSNPTEHLESMEDMRRNVDKHAHELKEKGIDLKLDAQHSAKAVEKQGVAHRAAQKEIDEIQKSDDIQQARLQQLRAEGRKLQTRINKQVVAAIPDNRAEQVKFGFTERTSPRKDGEKQPKAPKNAAPKEPGPVAGGKDASAAAEKSAEGAATPLAEEKTVAKGSGRGAKA